MHRAIRLAVPLSLALAAGLAYRCTQAGPTRSAEVSIGENEPLGEAGLASALSGVLVDLGAGAGSPVECRADQAWTTPGGDLIVEGLDVRISRMGRDLHVTAVRGLLRRGRASRLVLEGGVVARFVRPGLRSTVVAGEAATIDSRDESTDLVFAGAVEFRGGEGDSTEASAAGATFAIRGRSFEGTLRPPVRMTLDWLIAGGRSTLATGDLVAIVGLDGDLRSVAALGPADVRVGGHSIRFPRGVRVEERTARGVGLEWRIPVRPGVEMVAVCRGEFRMALDRVELADRCRLDTPWGRLAATRMEWTTEGGDPERWRFAATRGVHVSTPAPVAVDVEGEELVANGPAPRALLSGAPSIWIERRGGPGRRAGRLELAWEGGALDVRAR